MKKRLFFIAIFSVFFLLAACINGGYQSAKTNDTKKVTSVSQGSKPEKSSLQLLDNANIGNYLADSKGMTLYFYTKDHPGISNCTGQCLANWPAFSAKDFKVPAGFHQNDFSTIKREDNGMEQVTYKGFPLYYFIKDSAKGDVTGQGVGNVWYIISSKTTFEAASTNTNDNGYDY
jgi:predicted lipoprotein with Yx(FWY)xxD motif